MKSLKRGDLVLVSLPGEYGKSRPAVVVQSNTLSTMQLSSTLVCISSTHLSEHSELRLLVHPNKTNGLERVSEVAVDKIYPYRTNKIKKKIGKLTKEQMREIDQRLVFVLGLTE